jgi:hypothetical protein
LKLSEEVGLESSMATQKDESANNDRVENSAQSSVKPNFSRRRKPRYRKEGNEDAV